MPKGYCSSCGKTAGSHRGQLCQEGATWKAYGAPLFDLLVPKRPRLVIQVEGSHRGRMPRHLSRFFKWWFGTAASTRRALEYTYRHSRRVKRQPLHVTVGVQPLGEIGATHNPDLPGARWVEPLPCGDDAFDSWDDAVYLGASWENFMPAEGQDPFTAPGGAWARVERIYGAEPRWGRLT